MERGLDVMLFGDYDSAAFELCRYSPSVCKPVGGKWITEYAYSVNKCENVRFDSAKKTEGWNQ